MLSRLGLQKRIMAYVAVGLVLMFGAFFYLGMQAVERSSHLVFEERLGIAQGVASILSKEFEHVARDVEGHAELPPGVNGKDALERAALEIFQHLAEVDDFSFLRISSVGLFGRGDEFLASAPPGSAKARQMLPDAVLQGSSSTGSLVWWPEDAQPGQFVSIYVPLKDAAGGLRLRVLVSTEAISSSRPFVPFGAAGLTSANLRNEAGDVLRLSQYHLEVLAPSGNTILGMGPEEDIGQLSPHYLLVKPLMETGRSGALLHHVGGNSNLQDHVVAVAPVPMTDLFVALEQDKDLAMAVPIQFRRWLTLVGGLGLVATLLVAWVTTRHVVRPTERLTAAAVRMAKGDLSTAIHIRAQDEIGVLAENLEVMRQQLQSALEKIEEANQQLETRVQERTHQLQELVRRVLTAQEDERRRVALELHDETAQTIIALTFTLDSVLRKRGSLTSEETATLREAREIATRMLEGVRRLIYALRPVELKEMGLASALRWYAEEYLERRGVALHVAAEGPQAQLQDHVELALYRIGQEALSNVARHARANNVWITLGSHDSRLVLTVQDDGIGFDPNGPAEDGSKGNGIGLAGMRERANLIGALLAIDSTQGRGTKVRVEIPTVNNG